MKMFEPRDQDSNTYLFCDRIPGKEWATHGEVEVQPDAIRVLHAASMDDPPSYMVVSPQLILKMAQAWIEKFGQPVEQVAIDPPVVVEEEKPDLCYGYNGKDWEDFNQSPQESHFDDDPSPPVGSLDDSYNQSKETFKDDLHQLHNGLRRKLSAAKSVANNTIDKFVRRSNGQG